VIALLTWFVLLAMMVTSADAGVRRVYSTHERALVFTEELRRAAKELDVVTPTLTVLSQEEAQAKGAGPLTAAFVVPPPAKADRWAVFVVWFHLMGASDARLQCWARHEVTHILLGHRFARDEREAAVRHDVVRHFMKAKWRQDSACLVE
jgi:hypothetical protein